MSIKAPACTSILLALLFLGLACNAEETKGALSPKKVFVGDKAVFTYIEENIPLNELFAPFEAGAAIPAAFDAPRELLPADSSAVSIKSARLIPLQGRNDAALCEITFVPWKTGEITVPEIAFTPDGFCRSREVKVAVTSLAARSGTAALMPNRPPLLPPGSIYLLYIGVICVAAVCFLAALAARIVLKRGKSLRRIPAKRIRRKFARLLKAQRRRMGKDTAAWHAEFSAIARLFFYKMTGESKWLAADARDIARFLETAQSSSGEEAEAAKRLVAALFEIERIRFSGEGGNMEDEKEREREIGYIEALGDFVLLACAATEAFFPPADGEAAAPPRKKGRSRAVV